jgi:putative hydrolase of the HAD superfamily
MELNQNSQGSRNRANVIAYWLIPSEPEHSCFQQIVNDLASRYDAPVFEPHLTIHVGADCADAAKTALGEAACRCNLLRLMPVGIDESDEFIKTLFVQFAMSAELRKVSDIIRQAANDASLYQLKPHLSLLYKNLTTATRRELAASISVPLSEVTFDAIKAVRCVLPTKSGADVEAWHVVAAAPFFGDRI